MRVFDPKRGPVLFPGAVGAFWKAWRTPHVQPYRYGVSCLVAEDQAPGFALWRRRRSRAALSISWLGIRTLIYGPTGAGHASFLHSSHAISPRLSNPLATAALDVIWLGCRTSIDGPTGTGHAPLLYSVLAFSPCPSNPLADAALSISWLGRRTLIYDPTGTGHTSLLHSIHTISPWSNKPLATAALSVSWLG